MKLLISVDCDSDPASEIMTAFRVVDWPCVPNQNEFVHPFVENEDDAKVDFIHHHFYKGYIHLTLEPLSQRRLNELLKEETRHWLISTRSNTVSESEAWKILST